MERGKDLVEAGLTAEEAAYLDAVLEHICRSQFFAGTEDKILLDIRPNLAKYLKEQSVRFTRIGNPRFASGGYGIGFTDLSHVTDRRQFDARIEDKFGSLTLRVTDTVGSKVLWDRLAQER